MRIQYNRYNNSAHPIIRYALNNLGRKYSTSSLTRAGQGRAIPSPIQSSIQNYQFFASTLPGLEAVLHHELQSLGMNVLHKDGNNDGNGHAKGRAKGQDPGIHIRTSHGKGKKQGQGGVTFKASSLKDIYRCHLHLGTASHIFLRAGEPFYATGMRELVKKVGQMPFWKDYINVHVRTNIPKSRKKGRHRQNAEYPKFDIRVTTSRSRLYHTKGIAERVERGIAIALGIKEEDLLNDAMDFFQPGVVVPMEPEDETQPSSPDDNDDDDDDSSPSSTAVIKVLVRVIENQVEISVDTSYTPLHRRGYRLASGKAPLREDIAYGLLYSLGWGRGGLNNGEIDLSLGTTTATHMVDPFCGSGTILIEGASMRLGLPPGRLRDAPFEHSRLYNRRRWNRMIKSSLADSEKTLESIYKYDHEHGHGGHTRSFILGSDRDAGVIQSAKENIERAGVTDMIDLDCCAISSNRWFQNPSSLSNVLVATNPPYGRRLSPSREGKKIHPLLPLYQTLGKMDEHALDYGIVAHDVSLSRKSGVHGLSALFTTKHGGLTVCALGTSKLNLFDVS